MTKERLDWIMSGIDQSKLNKLEGAFIKQIQKKFERDGDLTVARERRLEQIYKSKIGGG